MTSVSYLNYCLLSCMQMLLVYLLMGNPLILLLKPLILNYNYYLHGLIKSNKLSLNTTKLYYTVFHRARIKLPNNSIKIKMDDANIMEVQCIKYLGVILDNKLSWIQHISYVKNKISNGICIMFKARNYINKNALLGLYHSHIYIYILTLYIAFNLGATHQIVTLILYLCYGMVFHLNYYLAILICCPYVS